MRLSCAGSVFLAFLLTDAITAKRLPAVDVQKCCRLGEMLQQINPANDYNASPFEEDDLQCIPGLGENWLPQIYAPGRKVFLKGDTVPSNWRLQELSRPFCGYGVKPKLVHLTVPYLNYYMLANGSLFVEEHHVLYEPGKFCIDKLSAMVCDADNNLAEQPEAYVDKKIRLKIRKCCGEGGAYSRENSTCVVVNGPMGHSKGFDVKVEDSSNTSITFVSGFPSCKIGHTGFATTALPTKTINIMSDGTLLSFANNDLHEIPPISYCVERTVPENYVEEVQRKVSENQKFFYENKIQQQDSTSNYASLNNGPVSSSYTASSDHNGIAKDGSGQNDKNFGDMSAANSKRDLGSPELRISETDLAEFQTIHVFSCISDTPSMRMEPVDAYDELRYTLYPIGLILSVIFLLATLGVGFLVPGNHHALHWRCQTYYVTCLLIGDVLLAVSQSAGRGLGATVCVTIAVMMHFLFLSAFFWLNTMCFNIWWTFRDFRPSSLEKGQESCRLRVYAAYAWGGPLLIAGCAALLDTIAPAEGSPGAVLLRPKFGEKRCWFYGDLEMLTYFYGPIGLLLFVNLLLFTSTARQLTCGLWKREEVKSTTERAALGRVCMKLVIVMGVTWIADVLSWAVGGPHYIWYATDLINALQGVFIFIVVGCQPQVWAALKRLYTEYCCRRAAGNSNAPQHSSSSMGGMPSIEDSVTHNTTANVTMNKIPLETVC